MRRIFPSLVLLLFVTTLFAQRDYTIRYQKEAIQLAENIDDFRWNDLSRRDRIGGGHYLWMQFYATPTQAVQDRIKASEVELRAYLGTHAYLVWMPAGTSRQLLSELGVRAIHPVPAAYKLSARLRHGDIGEWAIRGNRIRVTLTHYDKISTAAALARLEAMDILDDRKIKAMNRLDLLIPNDCLDELSALPFVRYVDIVSAPDVPEDEDARALHRSANLDTQVPGDRNYDGTGIGVLVRDDGVVGPHIDFQGRLNNVTDDPTGTHGDGVAGILTGAGNLNPRYRGMAAGAELYVVGYSSDFNEQSTFALVESNAAQITNSSFGNGCNDGYTTTTEIVDQQSNDFTSLLHVFSAGNSNGNDCGYGAGGSWGNITGGHKQGKNVIATANVAADADLANSSSRGPAHDGRIKPDITANGQAQISTDPGNGYSAFGGTSGASPGVAGVAAQLYQAYRELNDGEMPEAALIKAVLLNTANDYGQPGPDFSYGWGMLNGLRAVQLLEEERYLRDTLTQADTNAHQITLPEGVLEVRFMLYWRDPTALAGASRALVNDLDLRVLGTPDTSGAVDTLFPYVLDPDPLNDNLGVAATNGVDRLNNVEQVVIANPAAGTYTLEVEGFDVPLGPQAYYILYEVVTAPITVTYPNTRENILAGTSIYVQWDAPPTDEGFNVEYSLDNGDNWTLIGFAGPDQRLEQWSVPNEVSGQALIRVTSGDFSDVSDTTFSVGGRVSGLEVTAACPNSLTFSWNAFAGANAYDLYILGEKFMDVRGTTSETTITIENIPIETDVWYAIAARDTNSGFESLRTNARLFNDELFNCPLGVDLSITSIENVASDFSLVCNEAADSLVRVLLYNNGMEAETGFALTYQISGQPVVIETFTDTLAPMESVVYTFSEPLAVPASGNYDLTIRAVTDGDEYATNDQRTLNLQIATEAVAVPLLEDFEQLGFPPPGWQIINDDEVFGWVQDTVIGSDDAPSVVAFMNNYEYNAEGVRDFFVTDIYAVPDSGFLTFDVAKAQYSGSFQDGLAVEISLDCGETFAEVYFKENLELSTLNVYNLDVNWEPSIGAMWRSDTIFLDDYVGENAQFRFVNVNGYGNSTYIDNINVGFQQDTTVSSTRERTELEGVSVFPNPTMGQFQLRLPGTASPISLELTNALGQVVLERQVQGGARRLPVNVGRQPAGVYYLKIRSGERQTVKRLVIQ